ncbi:TetR/AcrR family transcriptional regulator [Bdellovibrio sp. HCB117]|uniref:TetR/AcrR family transcriptional regulator n=1 Tax=Bdellovibrio sp. HCB117 TaxID=3394359 RepID=UPI00155E7C81
MDLILTTSLEMLEQTGPHGFSMRALASSLKITPMAIYHYFPSRAALMKALSDAVYSQVVKNFESAQGGERVKIKHLLTSYYQMGLRYPNLTLTVFSTPEAFSTEAKRITDLLSELLEATALSPKRRQMWLDILIDFTHGSAIATAMVRRSNVTSAKKQSLRYFQQLDELLDQMF